MAASTKKDLSVYDFSAADEVVEAQSAKFRFHFAPKRPRIEETVSKVSFLQAFTGSSAQQVSQTDVISDDEGESFMSCSRSISSSETHLLENDDPLYSPDAHYAASPEAQETIDADAGSGGDGDDTAGIVISSDYVIYGDKLFLESRLTFSSDSVKFECPNSSKSSENDSKFVLELAIADITQISSEWSGVAETGLLRLCFTSTEAHDGSDVTKVIYSLTGSDWPQKQEKIKSLAARYGDIWSAGLNDDPVLEDHVVDTDMFLSKRCFADIEHFEDVVYPKGDPDPVSISKRDFELLEPDTFINDTIIDFYIKHLKDKIPPSERHRFHFFNSFFFRKLADLDRNPGSALEGRTAFERVRKWTRKVDVFEKDYIFIPVNFNLHWSLLVICHPGDVATVGDTDSKDSPRVPCILHMDSIKGGHTGLRTPIQSYLWEEWKERHPGSTEDCMPRFLNLRFVSLELPQQENLYDCGLFLLHYAELFLEEAPADFNLFRATKFSHFLTEEWFLPGEASHKRSLIRKLIHDLLNSHDQAASSAARSSGHLH